MWLAKKPSGIAWLRPSLVALCAATAVEGMEPTLPHAIPHAHSAVTTQANAKSTKASEPLIDTSQGVAGQSASESGSTIVLDDTVVNTPLLAPDRTTLAVAQVETIEVPAPAATSEEIMPPFLRRQAPSVMTPQLPPPPGDLESGYLSTPIEPPLGFTGRSSVLPTEAQESSHFVPVEDRWRIGFPSWDRYGKGHPPVDDYPYVEGHWWDPYNQNLLKGDYPIIGHHTFLNITAASVAVIEERQFPIGTTPFESTRRPFQEEFFGRPTNLFYSHYFKLSADLFHGDTAAFKPVDWRIKVTPVFNVNYLNTEELAVVNPNVLQGPTRGRTYTALEEWILEKKLSDNSPYYDFTSIRIGSQYFNSDFRGLIFSDTNRAIRLFGTRLANRDQFNIIAFNQTEKDTNSELNTFNNRNQNTVILNYYKQDCLVPGYTMQWSVHYNNDEGIMRFDQNDFLVRPDATGVFQPHTINVAYLGWATDGHIGRYNINSAFYWALGRDSLNPLANQPISVNAQLAALEVSYDRDWSRFRASVFYASGDNNINDSQGRGFDAIFDNPNFVGGQFSYWQRQAIRLFNVNLVNRQSLLPDLRSSKIQGQSNFVNPGIQIVNLGYDMDLTPKLKSINNVNYMWFDKTNVLEQFTFDGNINRDIGLDISTGLEYRPLLSNNIIVTLGVATLVPGSGFRNLYNRLNSAVDPAIQGFMDLVLVY